MEFTEASNLLRTDRILELASVPEGLRFLKLRSLSRKEHLQRLLQRANINAPDESATALFRYAVEARIPDPIINATINELFAEESHARLARQPELVSELYKMEVFDWGGLHQNSLEKTIVDNYVKKITSFEALESKVENELHQSMRGFVLCQWYNHWTSIIIEDLFNTHSRVLPAVGRIKKIDFFVDDTPFDLKVTYLPEGFIKEQRKLVNLKAELGLLKKTAKELRVVFDSKLPEGKLLEDLTRQLRYHPDPRAQELIAQLNQYRKSVLSRARSNPEELIIWLYENQGLRRFDAANRLFLVLVDTGAFYDSWKLKRAKPLLQAQIESFLDELPANPGRAISFIWEGARYECRSDVCFVVPP